MKQGLGTNSFQADEATEARISEVYGRLPLHFTINQGQFNQEVKFRARGQGYDLFLTSNEAVLTLSQPTARHKADKEPASTVDAVDARPHETERAVLRMKLVNANCAPEAQGLEQLSGSSNYFVGDESARWRTQVANYWKVKYDEVYPGADLVYYGNQQQLEYDFIVAPGADPSAITIDFDGADKAKVNAEGDLMLVTAGGEVRLHKPVVYQKADGQRREIASRYITRGESGSGFEVAVYDTSKPLVIDPVLSYSTYLGGTLGDNGVSIAVDSEEFAYLTGTTTSIDFPVVNPVQPNYGGGAWDVFVTKLSPNGRALIFSTYLGGALQDLGIGIAADAAGNAYIAGWTRSNNFPTVNALQLNSAGESDVIVAKITDFDVRLQDDRTGDTFQFTRFGEGEFTRIGHGQITRLGGFFLLDDEGVRAFYSRHFFFGFAAVRREPEGPIYTINDRNPRNNTCTNR